MTWRRKLLLLLCGCACGLLVCELTLRVMGISYPQPYVPDEQLGTRLQPGFSGLFSREGQAHVTVNSAGFRDRERGKTKPPGTYRIVVLGDSYAEAVQVPVERTFWSVLEDELDSKDQSVQVLNFGISGYGTAQELETLRHVALEYDPDLVLLAFLSGNDVRNNSKKLEPVKTRPFYSLSDDGQLTLDESFQEHPDFVKAQQSSTRFKVNCINSSRLLQLLIARRDAGRRMQSRGVAEKGLNPEIYRKPNDVVWEEAWQVTERLLEECCRVSKAAGAKFLTVTITNAAQVHPDPEQRKAYAASVGADDLYYPERRVQALGASVGFDVVTLAQPFADEATKTQTWFHGFPNTEMGTGHWNERGHALAGRTIAERIREIWNRERR